MSGWFSPRSDAEEQRSFLAIYRDHTIRHIGANRVSKEDPRTVARLFGEIASLGLPEQRTAFVAGLLTIGILQSRALAFLAWYYQLWRKVIHPFGDPSLPRHFPAYACYHILLRARPELVSNAIELVLFRITSGQLIEHLDQLRTACRFADRELQQIENLRAAVARTPGVRNKVPSLQKIA